MNCLSGFKSRLFFLFLFYTQLLGFATEELALRVGQTIGGLLNATLVRFNSGFGNDYQLTACSLGCVLFLSSRETRMCLIISPVRLGNELSRLLFTSVELIVAVCFDFVLFLALRHSTPKMALTNVLPDHRLDAVPTYYRPIVS